MKLKRGIKIILITTLILFALLQSFLSLKLYNLILPADKNEALILLKYESKSNSNYIVKLKENQFIQNENFDSEAYIRNFIEYINFLIKYEYKATSSSNIKGKMEIKAEINIYHRIPLDNNKYPKIWTKSYLIDEIEINTIDYKIDIEKDIKIDLQEYQQIVNEFKETIKGVNVDSKLQIKAKTTFQGTKNDVSFDEEYIDIFEIPLDNEVFKINHIGTGETSNIIYFNEKVKINALELLPLTIFNIVNFLIIILIIKLLFFFDGRTKFQKQKNKIEKYYDEIVVKTTTFIDKDKYEIIVIESFKELYELSRELNMPIMQYDLDEVTVIYYILKDETIYKFKLEENKII